MGVLRLYLALVVVFSHVWTIALAPDKLYTSMWFTFGMNGGYAVMFFYMISGFLISYALSHKYLGSTGGISAFYKGRFVRIFSMYWPVFIFVLITNDTARGYYLHGPWKDMFTDTFLIGSDWSRAFTIYPDQYPSAVLWTLDQSWTLGPELTFYLLAPLFVRSWKLAIAIAAASLGLRVWSAYTFGFHVIWSYTFFFSTVIFFLLGHAVRAASDAFAWLKHPLLSVPLIVAASALLCYPTYAFWDTWRFALACLCFAAALPSTFAWTKDNRVLNFLGDLSFPVYIVHIIVITKLLEYGLWRWLRAHVSDELAPYLFLGAVVSISLIVSVFAHQFIEMRVAQAMRWSLSVIARGISKLRPVAPIPVAVDPIIS